MHQKGLVTVFTNGCFDILHTGHLHTLLRARSYGDILIVGINSDESVRRLKGSSRPFVPALERAFMVAGFECVDYVTIFEEETPIETLAALRPKIHVKGGDYTSNDLIEADTVKSYGGKVIITPLIPGHSTTLLSKKLKGAE